MDLGRFIGDETAFTLEHRILNTVLLMGIGICLFTVVSNYVIGFYFLAAVSTLCAVVLGTLYYFSMVKKAYRPALLVGVSFAFAVFPVLWITSDGLYGPAPLYILIYAAMITVSVRSMVVIFGLAVCLAVMTAALMVMQYFSPQAIAVTTSRFALFAGNFIAIMAALSVITSLYAIILSYYRKEHARATDYLVKLEKQEMALEMARLDRLNLIGEMAAGIGHEVRNPLATTRGYLQILRNKKECDHYHEQFDLMIGELDRATAILTEFLSLSQSRLVALAPCDLNKVLERIFPLIEGVGLETGKEVVLALKKVPRIAADEQELRQLVLNLANNALDATAPGGRVTIGTYRDRTQAVLCVSDAGKGIATEIYAKLGTPFVTDKEKGTGLGIPICFRIAERHSAKVEIDTGAAGTTFRVRFPAAARRKGAAEG